MFREERPRRNCQEYWDALTERCQRRKGVEYTSEFMIRVMYQYALKNGLVGVTECEMERGSRADFVAMTKPVLAGPNADTIVGGGHEIKQLHEFEIKTDLYDLRADLKKRKWKFPVTRPTTHFSFVVPPYLALEAQETADKLKNVIHERAADELYPAGAPGVLVLKYDWNWHWVRRAKRFRKRPKGVNAIDRMIVRAFREASSRHGAQFGRSGPLES